MHIPFILIISFCRVDCTVIGTHLSFKIKLNKIDHIKMITLIYVIWHLYFIHLKTLIDKIYINNSVVEYVKHEVGAY